MSTKHDLPNNHKCEVPKYEAEKDRGHSESGIGVIPPSVVPVIERRIEWISFSRELIAPLLLLTVLRVIRIIVRPEIMLTLSHAFLICALLRLLLGMKLFKRHTMVSVVITLLLFLGILTSWLRFVEDILVSILITKSCFLIVWLLSTWPLLALCMLTESIKVIRKGV